LTVRLPDPEELLPRILRLGEEYEFSTFLIGVHVPDVTRGPEKVKLTRPLKERLGRALEGRYWPQRKVEFDRPELQIQIDAVTKRVSVLAAPIYIAGRYRKYARTISSTHWRHFGCGGKGCPVCNFRGHFAEGSVGEIIGRPLLEAARGEAYYFHGMGREDVDARMLGTGRPFVVEISQPKLRRLDLVGLRRRINERGKGLAEVAGPLAAVGEETVPLIKGSDAEKSYCAVVITANPLPPDAGERIASLSGASIEQRTPCRVRHRRAEKVRRRTVIKSFATILDSRTFIWQVRAGAGTYIKELAGGDGGRTNPSLSELLGTPALVFDLDVVAVHFTAPWERR